MLASPTELCVFCENINAKESNNDNDVDDGDEYDDDDDEDEDDVPTTISATK